MSAPQSIPRRYSKRYASVNSQSHIASYNNRNVTFGKRVGDRRRQLKLSQLELGKATGLKQPTISNIESGRNKGSGFAVQLSRALKCSPDWLVTGKGNPDELVRESPYDDLVSKYRQAAPHTREIIDTILNKEAGKALTQARRKVDK